MAENDTKGIKAVMIMEILGKPPEHLKEALADLIKQIGEEKSVEVKEHKIHEPVELKNQKDLYTTYAEIEVEVEEMIELARLIFKYMPAHIEIIEPELIALANNGWGDILSEITRRLHGYDEVARIIQAEKQILENKLREVMTMKKEESPKEKPAKKKSKKK